MTEAEPDVSVVICTRNRAERLERAVGSVLAALDVAAADGLSGELVVVDNGSTDGTADWISERAAADPRVRYVASPEPGIGRARNSGRQAVRGAAVLTTDDDTAVPTDWVVRMTAPLLAGEADVVSGGIAMSPELERPWMTRSLRGRYFADVPVPPEVNPGLAGANMGATREVVGRLAFDPELGTPHYPGAEDVIFYVQALEAGYRVRGVPDAVVTHHFDPARLGAARLRRIAEGYGRCDAYFFHHWLHASQRFPRLRLLARRGLLFVHRVRARRNPHDERLVEAARMAARDAELVRLRRVRHRYAYRGLELLPS